MRHLIKRSANPLAVIGHLTLVGLTALADRPTDAAVEFTRHAKADLQPLRREVLIDIIGLLLGDRIRRVEATNLGPAVRAALANLDAELARLQKSEGDQ